MTDGRYVGMHMHQFSVSVYVCIIHDRETMWCHDNYSKKEGGGGGGGVKTF